MSGIAYEVPDLLPFCRVIAASADDVDAESGLIFEKQAIYVGQFVPRLGDQFKVGPKDLREWEKQINTFIERGIKIPLPIGHTTKPEASRGEVIGANIKEDSKGRLSLFALCQFADVEAAKLAKTTDVSIYAPSTFTDGLGNEYRNPITHIALTDYPVVPDLEKFSAIVASLELPKMSAVKSLAKSLKLEFDEKDDDEKIAAKITAKFESDEKEKAEMSKRLAKLEGEKDDDEEKAASKKAANDDDDEEKAASKKPAISASLVGILCENRQMKIDNLVKDGKITPAAAQKLRDRYADKGNKATALALSHETDDGFDAVLETLKANEPVVSLSHKSPAQLSYTGENPMVADAKRRAEAFNGKRN